MVVVHLQTGMSTADPVTTDADGIALIPLDLDDMNTSDNDYSYGGYQEYVASAKTPDGKLMIVDLRGAFVSSAPGTSLLGEVFVDRTVVGVGAI